jgi:hypothetical protein
MLVDNTRENTLNPEKFPINPDFLPDQYSRTLVCERVVVLVGSADGGRAGRRAQCCGFSTCDDGIVVDLSAMTTVAVDATGRRAVAGGGRSGPFGSATQATAWPPPGGLVSTTGLCGFTPGGGIGHLVRAHGLASGNEDGPLTPDSFGQRRSLDRSVIFPPIGDRFGRMAQGLGHM